MKKLIQGADVVYTDSWMSYHISAEQLKVRLQQLHPYKVTTKLMSLADPKCIFMNCLPANREHGIISYNKLILKKIKLKYFLRVRSSCY